MKRTTTLLLAGLLAGALAALTVRAQTSTGGADEWVAPSRAAKKKNPIPADDASRAKGKVLYAKECASCHGDKGKGDGPSVKDLEKKPGDLSDPRLWAQSDGALFWKLTEGRKPMPSMEKTFAEEERWHVINYMRIFAPKQETASKTSPTKP